MLMASPNQMRFLWFQIPSVILFFWAQSSSAQFNPLCITQFALANHACSILPSLEAPPMVADDIAEHQNDTNRHSRLRGCDDDRDPGDKSKPKPGKDDDHKHCKDDDPKHGKDADHKHHDHQSIPRAYKNCCRWLGVVDHECVCEALLKLPPFLVKQRHEYTMMIEKACKFNYKCHGV